MKKIYFLLAAWILTISGLTYLFFLFISRPQPKIISAKTNLISTTKPQSTNRFQINSVNIIAVGDIMLGRSVMKLSLSKNDPAYPFEKVADKLRTADLVFGNLETPIVKDCPTTNTGMKFCASPEMLKGLTFAGIDIVNIANNHTSNFGAEGLSETKNYLNQAKIDYVGDGSLLIKNFGGVKFGFLGFDLVDKRTTDKDLALVANSKTLVDNLIIMVHWGTEYMSYSNEMQNKEAEDFINAGADLIIGGHPHWIQNIEKINGKPVFYSLGNFIFDQSFSEETKKGLTIDLEYSGKTLDNITQVPIYMSSPAQPEWRPP